MQKKRARDSDSDSEFEFEFEDEDDDDNDDDVSEWEQSDEDVREEDDDSFNILETIVADAVDVMLQELSKPRAPPRKKNRFSVPDEWPDNQRPRKMHPNAPSVSRTDLPRSPCRVATGCA